MPLSYPRAHYWIGALQGAFAATALSVVLLAILSIIAPAPGVWGTRPDEMGVEQRRVVTAIFPDWARSGRQLTAFEKNYSDIVIESLCLTDSALAAEMDMSAASTNSKETS